MTWFFAGALVVSTVVTAAGQVKQGDDARRAANTQGDLARANARIALQQGAEREAAQRRRGGMALGKLQAAVGQSGVQMSSGSAAGLIAQSATDAELDALNVRYTAHLQSLGYSQQEAIDRAGATNANRAGYYKAGTTIASAVASYYGATAGKPTTTPGGDQAFGSTSGAYIPYGGGV